MYRQIILAGFCLICYADNGIYQYMDNNGNLVISNKPKTSSQRYIILKEELKHEQQALNDAKALLVQNSKLANSKEQQERNKFLNNTINEHQKNIKILNKQLGYAP